MIRIGNQTAFSALTPLEPFEYAVQNGFTAFEWFPDKKETGEGWGGDQRQLFFPSDDNYFSRFLPYSSIFFLSPPFLLSCLY